MKRITHRWNIFKPVQVFWKGQEFYCMLENLNANGALFSSIFPARITDSINVAFPPIDQPPTMNIPGIVVHSSIGSQTRFGVAFTNLPAKFHQVLDQYLSNYGDATETATIKTENEDPKN